MIPASENLKADESARGQGDNRLIIGRDFVAGDGGPEFGFQARAKFLGHIHSGLKETKRPTSLALTVIHRGIRLMQERVGILAILVGEGYADRGIDLDLSLIPRHGLLYGGYRFLRE